MTRPRIALAAALPVLASSLPMLVGGRMIYGSMSRYGLEGEPMKLTREFVGRINDAGEFWLGVGMVLAGALSTLGVLWLGRAAARQVSLPQHGVGG